MSPIRAAVPRPARRHKRWDLLHERVPHAPGLVTPPDTLPPHQLDAGHARDVVQDPVAATTTDGDHSALRAPGRRGRGRDRDNQPIIAALDMLDMDTVQAQQHIAA